MHKHRFFMSQMLRFQFLVFFSAVVFLSNEGFSQPNEFFYPGFKEAEPGLSFDGAVKNENGILRLTNDTARLVGRVFYASPFQFKNSSDGRVVSFSSSFVFGIVPQYPDLGGHGFAFVVAPTKDFDAMPSQYLGLMNDGDRGNSSKHLFAVEFDTVQNDEFGDINDNHVGININDLRSNASSPAGYFSDEFTEHNLQLISGKAIKAWIDYDSETFVLNVTISPSSTKPSRPILSSKLDLSPTLKDSMYVGFSAATGLLTSSHYILGWSFKINGLAQDLDLSSLPPLPAPVEASRKKQTALIIGFSSVSAILILVFAVIIVVYLVRKIKNADIIEPWELRMGPHRYSYKELKQATKSFRDKELLGYGGFGRVYKGILPKSKTQIAVKRISRESKQGLREFLSEIDTIGRLRHRNLVQLLGWCRRRGDLLIVYDFMANGSLDKILFDSPKTILSWEQRFKIIKDVASGLLYLHDGYERVVIHRDVKASNILLDGELTGKVGDFGLARMSEHGANPSTTKVVGTLGYLAPELPRTGKATTSTDVFAFGALLLEVASGRRPIEQKAMPEELVLVDWVFDKYREGAIFDVVDRKLNGEYDKAEMALVLKLGLMCSSNSPAARPSMREVVRYLDGVISLSDELICGCGYEYNGWKSGHGDGFDEFINCFESSSSTPTRFLSFTANRDLHPSFASLSTSSGPLLL